VIEAKIREQVHEVRDGERDAEVAAVRSTQALAGLRQARRSDDATKAARKNPYELRRWRE